MSTANKAEQVEAALKTVFSKGTDEYFEQRPQYNESDSPSFEDAKTTYNHLKELYRPLIGTGALAQLPFATLGALLQSAQNTHNGLMTLRRDPAENVFRNFVSQLDNLAHQTYMYGVVYLVNGGLAIEAARTAIATDQATVKEGLEKLNQAEGEIARLEKQLENLITPAVSGALSSAFVQRQKDLRKDKRLWPLALPHRNCYPFLSLPQRNCYPQSLRIEERFCDEERFHRPRLKDAHAVARDRPVTAFMRHPVTELGEATRGLWLVISAALALFIVGVLVYIAVGLATAFNPPQKPQAAEPWQNLLVFIGVRSLLLLPLVVLLGFALTQYRKEREYEEEYAHKAAVAVSLPNYGDLLPASSAQVREQVIKGAADVIFSSPVIRPMHTDLSAAEMLKATKGFIAELSKLMPWGK